MLNRRSVYGLAVVAALAAVGLSPASAQVRLEARYSATLAGIPLGSGTWVIDIASDQYTAVASGRTSGLVRLVSDGSGSSGARGVIRGTQAASLGYVSTVTTDKHVDEVRMAISAGVVKEVSAEPPLTPARIACRSPRRTARA